MSTQKIHNFILLTIPLKFQDLYFEIPQNTLILHDFFWMFFLVLKL